MPLSQRVQKVLDLDLTRCMTYAVRKACADATIPDWDDAKWESREEFNEYRKQRLEYREKCIDIAIANAIEDARARAHLKAIENAEAAIIRQKLQDRDYDGIETLAHMMSKIRNKGTNGGAFYPYYWITINPKPDVTLSELMKQVNKFVKRTIVGRVEYVYEQRGATELELGKGMHVHMWVEQRGDITNCNFQKYTRNTFKMLVQDPQRHVDIKWMKEPTFYEDKKAYMMGAKTGEGKEEKCAMDKIWREKNNLQAYYIRDNGGLRKAKGGEASTSTAGSSQGDEEETGPQNSAASDDEEEDSVASEE